jgi:hypothetical protein
MKNMVTKQVKSFTQMNRLIWKVNFDIFC